MRLCRKTRFLFLVGLILSTSTTAFLHAAEAVRIEPIGNAVKKRDPEFKIDYWELQGDSQEAQLKVVVRVSPDKQIYLTVRHKGGTRTKGIAFLCDKEGKELKPYCYLDEVGVLNNRRPGSFLYQTIGIPMDLTKGKKQITLRIGASDDGARGIYAIHTHTNPLFHPREQDDPGKVIEPYEFPKFKPLPRRLISVARKKTLELMSSQCDRNAQEQLWAPDWKERVRKGEWPEFLVGGFSLRILKKDDGSIDVEAMKDRIPSSYLSNNNQGPLLHVGVMAKAYVTPGTRQYKDKVILERIALGLDFIRRAQAANGAFCCVWKKDKWLGGPNRSYASGSPLEGNGHRGFGYALWLTADAMEKEGLLDELIDDDFDAKTPKVPRRQAYIDLVSSSAAYLGGRGGHAPNQEMYQLDGLLMQLKALKALKAPLKRWPNLDKLDERLRFATGAVPLGENSWVSPKGISLEHGGYTCEYGRDQVTMYYHVYEQTGRKFAKDRARIAGDGFSHFVFPLWTEEKTHQVSISSFLNTRHRGSVVGDGFPPCLYQALVFRNPLHIRLFQLEYMNLREEDIEKWTHPSWGNWWPSSSFGFMRYAELRMKLLEEFCDPKSPLCADLKLPTEYGSPNFVWGDEGAQVVSFKDGNKLVMMSFNQWHNEFGSGYSFVEFQSPEYDQFLRIPHGCERDGEGRVLFHGLQTLTLGDWFIAMNTDFKETKTVELPSSFARNASGFVDLNAKKKIGRRFRLPPQSTIVVKRFD